MTGTGKNAQGKTTHRCKTCSKRFEGTGRRGRPFQRCPKCRGKKNTWVEADLEWDGRS